MLGYFENVNRAEADTNGAIAWLACRGSGRGKTCAQEGGGTKWLDAMVESFNLWWRLFRPRISILHIHRQACITRKTLQLKSARRICNLIYLFI